MNKNAALPTMTAEQALMPVKSGQRVFVGSGAAEPELLVHALGAKAEQLSDAEVVHILTLGAAPYADERFAGKLRHNALFIGANVRRAVEKGLADYTPCFLSEIPALMRTGRLPIDVALIHVSPPVDGACSLGVSVDVVKAAVDAADYVVAQVNPRMPRTCGGSLVDLSDIDAFVPGEQALFEFPEPAMTPAALWIGRYAAALVEDGATIQLGIGAVANAVAAALASKRDLGMHSEMIPDGVLPLIRDGVINGRRKTLHPGKVVGSFCLGSRRLYAAVDRNPLFELHASDYVNSPAVIARNERMVSINSALQVDLTGQVAADSIGRRFYSGVGGQVDFLRGAALSTGGRSIIALPSTAKGGAASRIVAELAAGTGVVSSRADVDFVVTEYGIASLKGKTIRERAVALIQLAHPSHRGELTAAAEAAGLLDVGHVLPGEAERYQVELESRRSFGGKEVFFRPLKPSDERHLKALFYTQSPETTFLRFGQFLKRLTERQFQELAAIDGRNSMALVGFVRERGRERAIAVGRYIVLPGTKLAEAAFVVHDDYQGRGIGTYLARRLAETARGRGLEGFEEQVQRMSPRMRSVLQRCFRRIEQLDLGGGELHLSVRFKDLDASAS